MKQYGIVNTKDNTTWLFKGKDSISMPKGTIVEVMNEYEDTSIIKPTDRLIEAGYGNITQYEDTCNVTPLNYERCTNE